MGAAAASGRPGLHHRLCYTDAMASPARSRAACARLSLVTRRLLVSEIHNLAGVSLMLTLVLYPYVYLLARAAFLDQSTCVLEAARTLGASPWSACIRVGLPMARPAIAAGVALGADGGARRFRHRPVLRRDDLHDHHLPEPGSPRGSGGGRQLATGCSASCFSSWPSSSLARRDRRFGVQRAAAPQHRAAPARSRGRARRPPCLRTARAARLRAAVAALIRLHGIDGDPLFSARFPVFARNSFVLAGVAALIVVTARRSSPMPADCARPVTTSAIRVASIGYAVPARSSRSASSSLAALDNALDGWMKASFGQGTGLLLSEPPSPPLRLSRPLSGGGRRAGGGGASQDPALARCGGADARRQRRQCRPHHPRADAQAFAADGGAACLRRRAEGIAGDDHRPALQFRHAGDPGLQSRLG